MHFFCTRVQALLISSLDEAATATRAGTIKSDRQPTIDAINHWRKGVAVYKTRSTRWTFPTKIRALLFNKITNCLYFLSAVVLASGQRRLRHSVFQGRLLL